MGADQQFKQLIDRILRCRQAEDDAKADTKDVYAELKSLGYDKTAAGALVAELRKKDKDAAGFEERSAILDLYREAYERASGTENAIAHTHEKSRAKASEDNGRTSAIEGAPVAGEVSSPPVVLRPHCRNPQMCGGYGREHCRACLAAVSEAAA